MGKILVNIGSGLCHTLLYLLGFASASAVKNPPAMQETQEIWVQSLGQDGLATHASILAWRIAMDRGAWWTTVHRVTEMDVTEVT